jgi:hypothetical protein
VLVALAALVLAVLLISLSCAKKEFPPGGPPDTTPPEILAGVPEAGATLVDRNAEVAFSFSESMDRESVPAAIFIAPPVAAGFELGWKGNDLRIRFNEPLKEDRTYQVTIGTAAADQHGNTLINSYTTAFSTGESLDSGSISGIVYDNAKPAAGITIVAYLMDETDSLDITTELPQYATQTGTDGSYKLEYVSPAAYVLFAFDDRNRNKQWTPPREKLGFPTLPALLRASDSREVSFIAHYLVQRDTLALRVASATIDQSLILNVGLSGEVLRDSLSRAEVQLITPDQLDTISVRDLHTSRDTTNEFKGTVEYVTGVEEVYLRISDLRDVWGNQCITEDDSILLPYAALRDTKPPEPDVFDPPNGARNVWPDGSFAVSFSEPTRLVAGASGPTFMSEDSSLIYSAAEQIDSYTLLFQPDSSLTPASQYVVTFDLLDFEDRSGNRGIDSSVVLRIRTVVTDSLGSFSGVVNKEQSVIGSGRLVLNYRRLPSGERFPLTINSGGRFTVSAMPGQYTFDGFVDRDGDGHLSAGTFSPFTFAEPVIYVPDTVTVRARFETEDIVLDIK